MSAKPISTILAVTAISAMNVYEPSVRRGEYVKPSLSKKEQKVRAKNKLAKQSRKQNRK